MFDEPWKCVITQNLARALRLVFDVVSFLQFWKKMVLSLWNGMFLYFTGIVRIVKDNTLDFTDCL